MKRKPWKILRARKKHAKKKSVRKKNYNTNIPARRVNRNDKPNTKSFVIGSVTVTDYWI